MTDKPNKQRAELMAIEYAVLQERIRCALIVAFMNENASSHARLVAVASILHGAAAP